MADARQVLPDATGIAVRRIDGHAEDADALVVEHLPMGGHGGERGGATGRPTRHMEAEHDVPPRHRVEDVARIALGRGLEARRGISPQKRDEAVFHPSAGYSALMPDSKAAARSLDPHQGGTRVPPAQSAARTGAPMTHNHAIVWMDSKEAHVFHFNAVDVE
eukprot:gene21518-29529_t